MPTPTCSIPPAPGTTECPITIRFNSVASLPADAEIEFLLSIFSKLTAEMDHIMPDSRIAAAMSQMSQKEVLC